MDLYTCHKHEKNYLYTCPICDLEAELAEKDRHIAELEEHGRRFYYRDGTFDLLATQDEAINRRIKAAADLDMLREDIAEARAALRNEQGGA